MTPYERISVAIACIALIVSLGTLYLTFFHKRTKLVGMLVHAQKEVAGVYDVFLEYVLCNTGNVQLLLKEVKVIILSSPTDTKEAGYGIFNSECRDYPAII